jgi:preprotein translocase subunit SecD
MKCSLRRFNTYLLAALAVLLLGGCQSTDAKRKRAKAVLRVHIESNNNDSSRTQSVPIYRENPIMISIERSFFLSEENVKHASVVDTTGGFALRIDFDREGTMLLEQYTGANRGRHLAIFSAFAAKPDEKSDSKPNEKGMTTRWLAAPLIMHRITDGVLVFTPDATREETEDLARGLNNVAKKVQDKEPNF